MKNKKKNLMSFTVAKFQAKRRCFLAITFTAIITFTFIACDEVGINSDSTVEYKGKDGTTEYKLIITQAARVSAGDRYELTVGAEKKSTGTVQNVTDSKFTLKPRVSGAETFTATVSGNSLTNVSGLITFDNETTQEGPGELTPVIPPPSGGGTGSGGPTNWTLADSPLGTTKIKAITYGGGRFVAGGDSGKIVYSDDGVNWTLVENYIFGQTSYYIKAIIYANGKFVAVGASNKIATSTDGITWSVAAENIMDQSIYGIAYGGGRFVAVGGHGKMAYSADGTSWTPVADSTFGTKDINAVAYGNNSFVTTTQRTSPVKIGSGLWASMSAGTNGRAAGVQTDGSLWTWGYSYLGNGATGNSHSPVKIGSDTNWKSVTVGFTHTVGIKTDGSLWAWGSSSSGALGDGTTETRLSPVKIAP